MVRLDSVDRGIWWPHGGATRMGPGVLARWLKELERAAGTGGVASGPRFPGGARALKGGTVCDRGFHTVGDVMEALESQPSSGRPEVGQGHGDSGEASSK
jgi:hypothetical protein